ncbi:MAG: pteridine-dependent deoxygenase, partial [Xanthomonadales bacterium]|nr:pteridine-dependent deoxygenase [Xanthomonadales bacterium]
IALQVDETFKNFASLLELVAARQPRIPTCFGAQSVLKVYLRDPCDAPALNAALAKHLSPDVPRLVLLADICRPELRVEIDGFHGFGDR